MNFWKFFAGCSLVVLLYAASRIEPSAPTLAAGPTTGSGLGFSPWTDGSAPLFVTQSADGKTLYFWGDPLKPKLPAVNQPKIIGKLTSDEPNAAADAGKQDFDIIQAKLPGIDLVALAAQCRQTAQQELGPGASPAAVDARAAQLWQQKVDTLIRQSR